METPTSVKTKTGKTTGEFFFEFFEEHVLLVELDVSSLANTRHLFQMFVQERQSVW
jgi:hypothetical protein